MGKEDANGKEYRRGGMMIGPAIAMGKDDTRLGSVGGGMGDWPGFRKDKKHSNSFTVGTEGKWLESCKRQERCEV
jgi:hypothetical protein